MVKNPSPLNHSEDISLLSDHDVRLDDTFPMEYIFKGRHEGDFKGPISAHLLFKGSNVSIIGLIKDCVSFKFHVCFIWGDLTLKFKRFSFTFLCL